MQEDEFGAAGSKKGGRGLLIAFLAGLLIGGVGTFVAQPLLGRRLPEAVRGKYETLQGPVTAKQMQGERLLLTVSTRAGAILATFRKQVEEINLLVEEGDTVALDVPGYQPFMQNPEIIRVAKPDMLPPAPQSLPVQDVPEPAAAEPGAVEPAASADTTVGADSIM